MERYEKLEMEIIEFETEDVIVARTQAAPDPWSSSTCFIREKGMKTETGTDPFPSSRRKKAQ